MRRAFELLALTLGASGCATSPIEPHSNPDAGDPRTSDSNLMGVWRADGPDVKGRLVEVAADRATHQFASRTEISFSLRVTGDTFGGTAEARTFDAAGRPSGGQVHATFAGERVLP